MHSLRYIFTILVVGLWVCTTHGDIYQWVDSQGVRNFTNSKPPEHINGIRIFLKAPGNPIVDQIEDTSGPLTYESRKDLHNNFDIDTLNPEPVDLEPTEGQTESGYIESGETAPQIGAYETGETDDLESIEIRSESQGPKVKIILDSAAAFSRYRYRYDNRKKYYRRHHSSPYSHKGRHDYRKRQYYGKQHRYTKPHHKFDRRKFHRSNKFYYKKHYRKKHYYKGSYQGKRNFHKRSERYGRTRVK